MKPVPEKFLFRRLTITLGLLAVAAAFFGILTAYFGISLIGGLDLGNKTIALSAALIWIFLGSVLAYHAAKPLQRPAGLLVLAVLILIAAIETIEFVFSVQGGHFFIETLFVSAGSIILGPSSSPISPAASGLVIAATFALMFLIGGTLRSDKPMQLPDVISILGLIISLVSITFVLSYAYGNPLLYGTQFIPIAFFSALAAFFTGIAIVTAAGPRAFPARYMTGGSTSARLLRVFVPLVIGIILLENIAFVSLPSWFNIRDAVLLSASLVLFTLATALVVSRVSRGMGLALDKAEQELVRKNEELGAMNEELTAIDEELRQTNDNLLLHERQLVQNNDELNELNEELTATQEELRQNIEELISAEGELRESQRENTFLADLLNRSEQPFGIGYPDGRLGIVNGAFERLVGYSGDELRSMDWASVLTPPEWRDQEQKSLEELHHTGIPVRYEKEYIRKDGSRVPIELLVHIIKDSSGNPLHYYSFITDITERKRIEEKLETTLQRFYLILSNMHYGILLVTDEDRIEFVNQAFCDFFDLNESPADLSNMSANEMIGKIRSSYRDPVAAIARIGEIVRQGQPVKDEDVAMYSGRVFLRDFIPIRLGGKRYGRLWIHIDITTRRKAEEELIQKNDDLNALNEELTATQEELHQNIDELSRREQDLGKALAEKEVLLSEIHHRVKNNLTAFISLLSLEGSTEDTPAGKMLKQDLQNRARSMALIHETLYRTNMYDEVDMGMYLTTLVDQIANSFRMAKGVKTIVDAHGVMLDIPRATPAGLIVNELVTNSFKYAFPESFDSAVVRNAPPTITVTFAKDGGEYLMIVTDNGIGLPPGFDLTTTKTLGLKLVNFLAKHQMRAKVEVQANKGTEFIFRMNT